jgi:hypothetical protein
MSALIASSEAKGLSQSFPSFLAAVASGESASTPAPLIAGLSKNLSKVDWLSVKPETVEANTVKNNRTLAADFISSSPFLIPPAKGCPRDQHKLSYQDEIVYQLPQSLSHPQFGLGLEELVDSLTMRVSETTKMLPCCPKTGPV